MAETSSTQPRRPSSSAPARRRRSSSSTRAIARVEKLNPRAERGDPPALRPGARRKRGGTLARRAVPRRADRAQGSACARIEGDPYHEGMTVPARRRLPRRPHRRARAALPRRRASCASAARTRPSSGSCRRPSPRRTARRATRGTPTRTTGGSSGGSAAAVASGMVAGRARERRWRLDPHPRELLRARRPEAVAGPHVARARRSVVDDLAHRASCA